MTLTYHTEPGYEIKGFLSGDGSVSIYEVFFGVEEEFVVKVSQSRVTGAVLALLYDTF